MPLSTSIPANTLTAIHKGKCKFTYINRRCIHKKKNMHTFQTIREIQTVFKGKFFTLKRKKKKTKRHELSCPFETILSKHTYICALKEMNEAVTVTSFNLFSSKYSSPQKFPYTEFSSDSIKKRKY